MKILKTTALFEHPPALRGAATNFNCIGWFQQEPRRQGPQIDSLESESNLDKQELIRSRMIELIYEIVETHGEVTIGKLGAIINVRDPIFSPKRYGSASLSALLKQLRGSPSPQ